MDRLRKSGLFKEVGKDSDEEEHSLEMQYPYLHLVLNPGTKVVPILVGGIKDLERITKEFLLGYLNDSESLFVISTDFCHWGKRFGFAPMDPKHQYPFETITEMDNQGINAIRTKNPK